MQIRNYTNIANEIANKVKYINLDPLCCQHPARCILYGSSGAGKTNVLTNLLIEHMYFDCIHIYSADPWSDPLYILMNGLFNEQLEEGNLTSYEIHTTLNDPIDINELDDSLQHAFVFDDFITESNQSLIDKLFIRGRKRNASCFFLSQSMVDTAPLARKNAKYILIFDLEDNDEAKKIIRKYGKGNKEQLFEIYQEIMKEPYNFMLIDKQTNDPKLRIRKNFDEVLI